MRAAVRGASWAGLWVESDRQGSVGSSAVDVVRERETAEGGGAACCTFSAKSNNRRGALTTGCRGWRQDVGFDCQKHCRSAAARGRCCCKQPIAYQLICKQARRRSVICL